MMPNQVDKITIEQTDRALFNRIACFYARKDSYIPSSLARRSQLLSALKPILDERCNLGTIVEVGCGIGASAKYLVGCYERYIGIDQSEEMVKAARMFNQGNAGVEFIAENIKSKDLPQNVADVILSVGALHHMTELEDVIASLAGIAKPGAFLVAREPQNGNPLIQMMRRIRGIIDPTYSRGQIFFSEQALKELLTKNDITDLSIDFQGFLTSPFAQVVLRPQFLFVPLSRIATQVDPWLKANLPRPLKKLSFDIVAIGRFDK